MMMSMMGIGMVLMMGGVVIIPLLLIGGVVLALGYRTQSTPPKVAPTKQTSSQILDARYARGEITREEYEQVRQDLNG